MASVEQTLTQTHEQQRRLLDFFQNKQQDWEDRVSNKELQAQEAIDSIHQSHNLPMNLIPDMFLTQFDEVANEPSYDDPANPRKIPRHGFRPIYGRAKIELVSAYNFGFQGLVGHAYETAFRDANPDKVTDDPWQASPRKILANLTGPVKHAATRIATMSAWAPDIQANRWGGLRAGHGHILRVVVPAYVDGGNNSSSWISLELENIYAVRGTLDLRFWLYVRSGGVSIGNHEGYNNQYSLDKAYDSAEFSEGASPWRHLRVTSGGPDSAHNIFRTITIGADPDRDTEYYIALPYLAVIGSQDEARVGNYGGYIHD